MQHQEMTLNIRYDAPPEVWDKVSLAILGYKVGEVALGEVDE